MLSSPNPLHRGWPGCIRHMIIDDIRLKHGNSLEHGYFPGVPTPRVRLPERRGRLIEPT